jgi:hypothetical protein
MKVETSNRYSVLVTSRIAAFPARRCRRFSRALRSATAVPASLRRAKQSTVSDQGAKRFRGKVHGEGKREFQDSLNCSVLKFLKDL